MSRRMLACLLGSAALLVPSAAAAGDLDGLAQFQSPSKNIGCAISKGGVRCDIRQKTWQNPPKPADCELDWGGGLAVDKSGRAGVVCAGDTALGAGPVLGYGDSIRRGRFVCRSTEAGMRCRNSRNDHGFFLAKDRYRLF